MTIDEDNSIYVGGIRYDCTEGDLRHAFELYGSIVAVKIMNDRGRGGNCYAFISFANPRSASDAISGMNGGTIGGRMVRVNEVRTRGAGVRPNYGGENFRRNPRSMNFNRGRGRERGYEEHENDRYRDRSRNRERGYELTRGEQPRGRFYDRDDDATRGGEHRCRGNSRDYDHETQQDHDSEFDQEQHSDRVDSLDRRIEKEKQDTSVDADSPGRRNRKDKDQHSKRASRSSRDPDPSSSYDRHGRELSTESSDHHDKFEEQVDSLSQRREELIKENAEMQKNLIERNQHIVDLRRRSLKLEDALTSAKEVYSLRQTQLTKVHKCFLQVKDYGERLKNSEHELQGLVESLMVDLDASGDGDTRMGIENGSV